MTPSGPNTLLILGISPSFALENIQFIEFTLNTSIFLGDMNEDGILNVLDVVLLVNLILTGNDSNPLGDINQDGIQNVQDIVILINMIIEN